MGLLVLLCVSILFLGCVVYTTNKTKMFNK